MRPSASSFAAGWRFHPAARGNGPWLLLSALLHGALFQLAPLGTVRSCCGADVLAWRATAATPHRLSVSLGTTTAKITDPTRMAESAKTPTRAATMQEASAGSGFLPYYHPPGELSTKPQAIAEIRIADAVELAGIQSGNLVLELFINETGRLDGVRVESTSLPESFQEIVADTFREALFVPGMKNHLPVKSRLRIVVTVEEVLETTLTKDGSATAI